MPEGYPYKGIETILDGTFEFADIGGIYGHEITDENFAYVDSESYAVIWDGVTYQCVATTFGGISVLGNLRISGDGDDTGEPFLFAMMSVSEKKVYANNTAATHTIIVRKEVTYPIASEFLPEGYPYKKKVKILPETMVQIETANEAVNNPFIVNFTAGSLYKVIWDGIAYEVVAANIKGATAIGNAALANMGDDTGEPFVIVSADNRTVLFAETAGSHTISIIVETIHTIAPEFLPDEYVTETELTSKRYLTSETDPTVPAWAKAETKPSYDFSELTVNDPESAKTALAIENGMILKDLQAAMPSYAWWESVTYGNGKFVAVVYKSNKAAYSKDGITWTATTLPSNEMWNSVTYGNGKFVAIANDSVTAAYSEDGITWTATTMTNSERWYSVAYGNGKFVAVVYRSDKAAYSTDGITWTATTMPSSENWTSITYGNGKFVAIPGSSNKAAYSEDGITWTATTMPSSENWMSITYGNGKFVAVATNSTIATYDKVIYSEDGIIWHNTNIPSYGNWYSVAYGNGKFVTVAGNSNEAAYSEDGITWTAVTLPSSEAWMSITYGNGKFVAVVANSTKVAYSEDGITWKNSIECLSQNNSNITEDVRSIIGIPSYSTANNGQFLRVIDGIPTWTEFLPTLTSPNGTKYQLTVSDDGTLSAVVVS